MMVTIYYFYLIEIGIFARKDNYYSPTFINLEHSPTKDIYQRVPSNLGMLVANN